MTKQKLRAEDVRRAWKGNNEIYRLITDDPGGDINYLAVLEVYCTDIAHYLGVTVDELHTAINQYGDKQSYAARAERKKEAAR